MSAYTGSPESALKPAPAAMRRWVAEAMAAAAAAMADSDGCGSDWTAAASAVGDGCSSTTVASFGATAGCWCESGTLRPAAGGGSCRRPQQSVSFGGLIVAPKISAAKLRTAAVNAALVEQELTAACEMWCVAHCFSGNALPKQSLITRLTPRRLVHAALSGAVRTTRGRQESASESSSVERSRVRAFPPSNAECKFVGATLQQLGNSLRSAETACTGGLGVSARHRLRLRLEARLNRLEQTRLSDVRTPYDKALPPSGQAPIAPIHPATVIRARDDPDGSSVAQAAPPPNVAVSKVSSLGQARRPAPGVRCRDECDERHVAPEQPRDATRPAHRRLARRSLLRRARLGADAGRHDARPRMRRGCSVRGD
eukprot:scaffold10055_cov68-Phaeocystis_antarctica.AAC.1